MNNTTIQLERLVDRYLAGGPNFWDFYREFMEIYIDAELTDDEQSKWDEIYELLCCQGQIH